MLKDNDSPWHHPLAFEKNQELSEHEEPFYRKLNNSCKNVNDKNEKVIPKGKLANSYNKSKTLN